jgi:integrase
MLHITDMCEVGKPPRREPKAATLTTLKRDLGKEKIGHLDRQKLIDYGKMRAEQGAGPVTLGIDIGVIKMIITHAAAVHGLDISPEPVDLARVALKRLGLIGKGTERDRRPTTDELNRLFRCFDDNERLTLPMTRIVKFAVATAMRLDEICRVEWADLDVDRRIAPRGHKPPVRGRLRHRASLAGYRPQGLEDAAPLHPYPPGNAAPARRVARPFPARDPRSRVIGELEGCRPGP